MYLRLTIAAVLAVVLLGTHWKAYHSGRNTGSAEVQQQWDTERNQATLAALAASEAARKKEQALAATVKEVSHALDKEKAANAAAARAHADRLRQYAAALRRADTDTPRPDTATTPRTDEPFAAIAGECGRALVEMDGYARELAARANALQSYAGNVCVTVPDGR